MNGETIRCDWANHSPLERDYHDRKWGIPVHDERELFKMLILEGKQAGLSWSTILLKMETLCSAFDDFDPALIVNYDEHKLESLLQNSGIIRNRLKVKAVVHNAKAYFKLCDAYGSLDRFFWSYVNHQTIINAWENMAQVPASTPLSDAISKDLKKLGFKFVGSTIIYAFMQSVGMVNDHLRSCAFYRHH
jgi:DNA-3-methyladenine glycosylase I